MFIVQKKEMYTYSEDFFMTAFSTLRAMAFQPQYSLLAVGSHQLVARCPPRQW
jgi:hypothetical protein